MPFSKERLIGLQPTWLKSLTGLNVLAKSLSKKRNETKTAKAASTTTLDTACNFRSEVELVASTGRNKIDISIRECTICAGTHVENPLLCRDCQQWDDARHAFVCLPSSDLREANCRSLADVHHVGISCIICHMIGKVIEEHLLRTNLSTCTKSVQICFGGPHAVRLARSSSKSIVEHRDEKPQQCVFRVALIDTADHPSFMSATLDELSIQVSLHYGPSHILENVELWDAPFINLQLLRGWGTACYESHRSCHVMSRKLPLNFRVIDVNDGCIVERLDNSTFVALSYTWGSSWDRNLFLTMESRSRLTSKGSLCGDHLPPVVADAMTLCRDLSEQFLWVDSLCILQDDSSDVESQIKSMDAIYQQAKFTIIAATSQESVGLPGTSGRPRKSKCCRNDRIFDTELRFLQSNFRQNITSSKWSSRGWTFQEELLSTRRIYICDHEAYFACNDGILSEELGALHLKESDRKIQNILSISSHSAIRDCIESYTKRELSHPADILNAFTGITSALSTNLSVGDCHESFWMGLREKDFASALLWGHVGGVERRPDVPTIPTWSWAAWIGQITYSGISYGSLQVETGTAIGTLFEYYFQADATGPARRLDARSQWFGKVLDRKDLNSRNSGVFTNQMSYLPDPDASADIWRQCPVNPWSWGNLSETSRIDIMPKIPGALVFKSTVATLFLQRSTRFNRDSRVSVDIATYEGVVIGALMDMDEHWVATELDAQKSCEFIVVCGGVLGKSQRKELWRTNLSSGVDCDPWLLHVMLVERDQSYSNVFRRVSLGVVYTRHWARIHYRWKSLILV